MFLLFAEYEKITLYLYLLFSGVPCIYVYFISKKQYSVFLKNIAPEKIIEYYDTSKLVNGIVFPKRMIFLVVLFALLCLGATLFRGRLSKIINPVAALCYALMSIILTLNTVRRINSKLFSPATPLLVMGMSFAYLAPALLIPEKIKKHLPDKQI